MASRSPWDEGLGAVASQAMALMSLAHELGRNGKEVAPGGGTRLAKYVNLTQ